MNLPPATLVPLTRDLADPTLGEWIAPVPGAQLTLPDQVDGWSLERLLGEGSTATVHLVRKANTLAVVKLMRLDATSHAGAAIRHERRWLQQNALAGSPRVLAQGDLDDGRPWFVMTMAPGTIFPTWWTHAHPLPVQALVAAVAQTARIMGSIHRQGWIHRDLKPSNLAIGPDGRVTVLDWGLVHRIQQQACGGMRIAGTPGFMPPELLRGLVPSYTPNVDTFALGCTLAVLLCRQPIGVGELRPAIVRSILCEAGLKGLAANTLHHIICRAISIAPSERWADGDALAFELESWMALMAEHTSPASTHKDTAAAPCRQAS